MYLCKTHVTSIYIICHLLDVLSHLAPDKVAFGWAFRPNPALYTDGVWQIAKHNVGWQGFVRMRRFDTA